MKNFRLVDVNGVGFWQVFHTSKNCFRYCTLAPCGRVIESKNDQFHTAFQGTGKTISKYLLRKVKTRKPRVAKYVTIKANGKKMDILV